MATNSVVRTGTVLGEGGLPAFVGPPFSIVGAGDFGDGLSPTSP
jgi:NAD dependent epimerase/dehydratase family enzyme